MRSSKSRSRSKPNRPRTLGNIINRVFDSSGPEGKVRGTPQQLIEKYQQLGRDAQLSNDRVAAENFMQHSEHYTRLLGEAMREMAAEQEARQAQQPSQNGQYNTQRNDNQRPDNQRPDNQRPDNQRNDSPRADNQRSDNQRSDNQRSDNQRNDNQRGDNQRSDTQRSDNQRNDRPEFRNDRNEGGQQPRYDQPRGDQPRGDQPRSDQPRTDEPRGDQPRFDANRDGQRGDQPRTDRRPDVREDRRPAPAAVVDFPEVEEESGLVETPEARREPLDAATPVVLADAGTAPAAEEPAKRSRAPRRPRTEAEPTAAGDTAPEKPARSRGPTKPREAAE